MPMEYQEFRRHLGKAGLTVNDYAALLRVRPSSISNYAKKKFVPQAHAIIAVSLGDAGDRGVDFVALLSRYGVFADRSLGTGKVAVLENYRPRPGRGGKS